MTKITKSLLGHLLLASFSITPSFSMDHQVPFIAELKTKLNKQRITPSTETLLSSPAHKKESLPPKKVTFYNIKDLDLTCTGRFNVLLIEASHGTITFETPLIFKTKEGKIIPTTIRQISVGTPMYGNILYKRDKDDITQEMVKNFKNRAELLRWLDDIRSRDA